MKKIEAVIRHYKLEDVKNALTGAGLDGGLKLGAPADQRESSPAPCSCW
jgi:hypothetical protein